MDVRSRRPAEYPCSISSIVSLYLDAFSGDTLGLDCKRLALAVRLCGRITDRAGDSFKDFSASGAGSCWTTKVEMWAGTAGQLEAVLTWNVPAPLPCSCAGYAS